MANSCYNLYSFYGNDKVIEQVKMWRTELDSISPTEEDPNCMRAIRAVFYPNVKADESLIYGSKWVHPDIPSIGPGDTEIGLQSAWNPPEDLHKRMACLLYHLDNHVIVSNEFNVEGLTLGIAYATPYNSESSYYIDSEIEIDQPEDEDEEEDYDVELAEDEANQKLIEEEVRLLNQMINDVPEKESAISQHLL